MEEANCGQYQNPYWKNSLSCQNPDGYCEMKKEKWLIGLILEIGLFLERWAGKKATGFLSQVNQNVLTLEYGGNQIQMIAAGTGILNFNPE